MSLDELGVLAVQFQNSDIGRLGAVQGIVQMARVKIEAKQKRQVRSEEGLQMDRTTIEIFEQAALRHVSTFNARQVLDVLWGLDVHKGRENAGLFAALTARVGAVAPLMSHLDVPGTLRALATRSAIGSHARHEAATQIAARAMHPDVASRLTPGGIATTLQVNAPLPES